MAKISLQENEALLSALLRQGHAVAHDCEGTLACASCAVIVAEGAERLHAPSENEQDILDRASLSQPGARLSCQATGEAGDLVVLLPNAELPRLAKASGLRAITLSERAARHFAVQLAKHPAAIGVRLSVERSGCSGFGYRVGLAETARPDDTVFQTGRIALFVDSSSLPYVQGTVIDLVRERLEQRLRFSNPNALQTCGCGESFGTAP